MKETTSEAPELNNIDESREESSEGDEEEEKSSGSSDKEKEKKQPIPLVVPKAKRKWTQFGKKRVKPA